MFNSCCFFPLLLTCNFLLLLSGKCTDSQLSPSLVLLCPTAEGYAAFQEDSSGDEAESPSKLKRSKGIHVFKKPSFSKKKEKDFKIKEKPKDEKHKEEKHKEDKHKEKKSKDLTAADVVKQWKEKKKKKKPIQETEIPQVDVPSHRPVFGIPLSDAVDRTMMYDGIRLPAVFRECIDYVEKYGMKCEGIYRVSGTLGTLTCSFLRSLPAIFLFYHFQHLDTLLIAPLIIQKVIR